ncbi:MAG: endolytic transglycosylase MltG [Oscillospiraceae bacterium]|nr:endolytic transglycosylase MltG [Oscillospiraceae bacterium]
MDNKQFPEQENTAPTAQEETFSLPESDESEIVPMIEELSFSHLSDGFTQSEPEQEPADDLTNYLEMETIILEPQLSVAEEEPAAQNMQDLEEPEGMPSVSVFPEEEPSFYVGEITPEEPSNGPSFMERIPDVEDTESVLTEESSEDIDIPILPNHEPEAEAEAVPSQTEENADTGVETYTDPVPAPKDDKKYAERPTIKGRPKRKKGEGFLGIPNILVTFVWLALILAIGVTLGRMLWVCAADVLAFGRDDKQVTITVYEADTMDDITNKLYEAGLIRYRSLFNLYADISDAFEDIKPGIYDLNTRYDYHALVNFMSPSSTREVVELTIPEGYTCRQIFALLEEHRVCTAVDIAAYAANGELSDYWFLEGVERGSEYCLEGYLFPDTYQFYKNSSPREALEKMLNNFGNRFTEEMLARLGVLNENVTDGTYTIRQIVIVASLIEKESAAAAESATIASVIYNRLFNWEYPALLNIDAAIVYAQGGNSDTIDTSLDSPYNTYRYTGLTPTPISNPGLSSLNAALNPENTNYYFYVLNPATGMHQFSKTQAEHDAWIDEFYG